MTETTIRLRDMTDTEFEAYLERMIPEYAKEGARATGMAPDEALAFARRHGLDQIGLHVFKTNEGAIRLYERLGYEVVDGNEGGMRMAKRL